MRKANEPEAADSIFEISMLESILPRLVCLQISCALVLPEGGVQQFWWQFSIFQNHEKLQSGADVEGFGASREPLDLPSRAARISPGAPGTFSHGAKHSSSTSPLRGATSGQNATCNNTQHFIKFRQWCEALSSGGFFGKIRGQNMQSHRFAREHWNSIF